MFKLVDRWNKDFASIVKLDSDNATKAGVTNQRMHKKVKIFRSKCSTSVEMSRSHHVCWLDDWAVAASINCLKPRGMGHPTKSWIHRQTNISQPFYPNRKSSATWSAGRKMKQAATRNRGEKTTKLTSFSWTVHKTNKKGLLQEIRFTLVRGTSQKSETSLGQDCLDKSLHNASGLNKNRYEYKDIVNPQLL